MANNKTNPITFITLMGLMLLVVFGLYKGCQSCSSPKQNVMLVNIAFGVDGVKIYFMESYSDVRIKLNNDYSARIDNISSFSEEFIPYSDFTKSSGDRFSILLTKPKSVLITGYRNNEKYREYFKQPN